MDSFDNMMKAACHIKSYQMSFDKQKFEKLPEFYKTGLYCCEMLSNVRKQKEFHLKKAAFEVHKSKGVELLSQSNYDDAHYSFCKSLVIFKYIKNKNKNWKNEGVKDEELEYFEDEGENSEEREEIKRMKISALLNISLCDLNLQKFPEVRAACDEVIKLDPKNAKAYYRKAKSYLDCKTSLLDDFVLAAKELEIALKFAPENNELRSMYNSLTSQIDHQKKEEKQVFKSFFRNVNYEIMQKEDLAMKDSDNNSGKFTKVTEDEAQLGKPEIRILNLIIEQCYVLIDRLEREGDRLEVRKLRNIVERAKVYKEDLQKLLELDFEHPNEDLRIFAEKHNLDLKDPNVKEEFFKIRKNYLEQINKFYEDNLLKVNPQDILKEKERERIQAKKGRLKSASNNDKEVVKTKTKSINNKTVAKEKSNSNNKTLENTQKKIAVNYQLIGSVIVLISLIYYLIAYN